MPQNKVPNPKLGVCSLKRADDLRVLTEAGRANWVSNYADSGFFEVYYLKDTETGEILYPVIDDSNSLKPWE